MKVATISLHVMVSNGDVLLTDIVNLPFPLPFSVGNTLRCFFILVSIVI